MSAVHSIAPAPRVTALLRPVVVCLVLAALLPIGTVDRAAATGIDHLVVSELMTGGVSASDELIELYNPSSAALPLEGLELVYVTASGATVSRRAAWDLGAPEIPAGGHLLVANELGVFAPIADALYASGMAAAGGSVALRIQGAGSAIDAVGWGTAASTWLEGAPVAAPPAGSSIERLPGGSAGSTVDTNDNAADFTLRSLPDPQNSGSPPVPDPIAPTPDPSATPTASATPTPTSPPSQSPTPSPTPPPSETPGPTSTAVPTTVSIATARALPDGAAVTVEGTTLSASDFTDGGGYLSDESGAIAVLLDEGSFPRGARVLLNGVLDDRFAQRTIRASPSGLTPIGAGGDPLPLTLATGSVGESVEANLVRIEGAIDGGPTTLSGGLAFDVDDGSGSIRVVVGSATGIHTTGWTDGARLAIVGIVGQRDSSGTGTSGYRVQPRDEADIEMLPSVSPTPSTGASPSEAPTPTPSDGDVISIAEARSAAKNARVTVRGVVTLASGTVDAGSAVIQDGSGAILLRLGDEAGAVSRGQLLEVAGARSTKGGMLSIRVSTAPRHLGSAPEPTPRALRTGDATETAEAQLVAARGAVVASARTSSSGTVSFEIDDGTGPLRVVLGASLAADGEPFASGTWVEVSGVLGQETTGSQPTRGYRVWPRDPGDVRILAAVTGSAGAVGTGSGAGGTDDASHATSSLAAVGEAGLAHLRVGATLVASAWPELGVGGLLWDGRQLVGIAPASGPRVAEVIDGARPPITLELLGLRELGRSPRAGLDLVVLGDRPTDTVVGSAPVAAPRGTMPAKGDPATWVSLVGRVSGDRSRQTITVSGAVVAIERRCREAGSIPEATANLVGVGMADPPRIIVGCDGVRPAPSLALAAIGSTESSPATNALDPSGASDAAGAPVGRLLPVMLLACAAALAVAGIILGRRFGGGAPDGSESEEPAATGDPAPPGPQLTLVRLPTDHGP